ncbi:Threonine-phosphate decarboxylase [Jannaschia seosinensis]|uniref:Aminotransferase n=1 Tax=Jannaschia seosinensis TaxID=313367 RepID=A0A0M7BD57_9RHOB|nr:aminotransferase class I/II-fold pyridoxal phosphate-dependent enzyme [Jannaschia seosinensis]CUH39742.1 Threonine-phosphate decarboxylase [Jannaschia seosinensis]
MTAPRDHGGGLDAARARWGGAEAEWLDLSTGINPRPYPLPDLPAQAWTRLPDRAAEAELLDAARGFWKVPDAADLLAAPGASALIARMPLIVPPGPVDVPGPTYNEHEAALRAAGREIGPGGSARVIVHPNNPDGRLWSRPDDGFTIIDESFCDTAPEVSHVAATARPGTLVLKSFGKFWGLAGLRLGFAIGHPDVVVPLREALGPWPVSGPALRIGAAALRDRDWAEATRGRLARDARRLDGLMAPHATLAGGTDLFRLYDVPDAAAFRDRLARHRIWSRIFPYSRTWLRLGLPPSDRWPQIEAALA